MGCCCCGGDNLTRIIPEAWYAQFKALKLSDSEIRKFLDLYQKIDRDQSGAVDMAELLNALDIENNSFTRRAFSVFDMNNSGKIDFREFVLSLWNYCTLGMATLDIFTFDLYDKDKSGILSEDEVQHMVKDLYGRTYQNNPRAHHIIQEMKKIELRGDFDLPKFTRFAKSHQELLFPAFQMQLKIQENVFGRRFWERCSNRRIQLSNHRYVSIVEIMQMHVQPKYYDKMTRGKSVGQLAPGAAAFIQNTGSANQRMKPKNANGGGGDGHGAHVAPGN
eukprot:gene4455-4880_t